MTEHRVIPSIVERRIARAGICAFADPFDVVLRELSPAYIEALWNKLRAALPMLDVDQLKLGFTHPAYTSMVPEWSDPLTYFGWVTPELWRCEAKLELAAAEPALAVAPHTLRLASAEARARQFDGDPDDFARAVSIVRALAVDEVTDWLGVTSTHEEIAREPWRAIVRAHDDSDAPALAAAVARAEAEYGHDGFLVVVEALRAIDAPGGR